MRLVDFGHLGDGNLHYNVQAPEGVAPADFQRGAEAAVNAIVYDGRASGDLIRTHIMQIKDLLAGTDVTIRSVNRAYVLVRRFHHAPSETV